MQVSNSDSGKDIYEDFLVSDHITTTAYLRISLPNLLAKEDYKKVLYLDSDVLVLDDIVKLYDEPLNGKQSALLSIQAK